MYSKENIRNVAIVAHVDHGKTTLVDAMLRQSGTFRENEHVSERVMDSNDLEKERGITIIAKNTSIFYNDMKINIVDTPGHADFGGEVERSLKMVEGVLLLVDAFEGCMPQTRFVLGKALGLGLYIILVVNKVDKPNARPLEVVDNMLELLIDLNATEKQLDSPIIYTSGRNGWASVDINLQTGDMKPLFEIIKKHIPHPNGNDEDPFQMLVSNIDFDEYTGRIAIGKIKRGKLKLGQSVSVCRLDGSISISKVTRIFLYKGLKKVESESIGTGEIAAICGISDVNIGETICDQLTPEALQFVKIDEPMISMTFSVNDSPFVGKEGKFVTSRHLRERLFREIETNISLKVEETDSTESFVVSGRGELHLSVLIENMRREGYELQVSKPVVITKIIDGVLNEPIEYLTIETPDEFTGTVIEITSDRKGQLVNLAPSALGFSRIEFRIPARGLIGFRSYILNCTKGSAVINHIFDGYEPFKGMLQTRSRGSLVSFETGESIAFGLYNAQERGRLFIGPGNKVYGGMVVGENSKSGDLIVNVCKRKQATNMRASGSDESIKLIAPTVLSLEQSIEFINEDELVEVTPLSIRIRKKILDSNLRSKTKKS
ncbi:MAG: translational GTPase TypA [Clostridiales bacterium]|nr:translational GTPase TypA [Clostridiales bacterium]